MPNKMMAASVEQGVVDAAFAWEPYVSHSILKGKTRIILDMNRVQPRYPWYVIVATPDAISNKSRLLEKVLVAHIMAIDYINEFPEESNQLISQHFRLHPIRDASGVRVAETDIIANARQRIGWEYSFSSADLKFLQAMINYSQKLGYVKEQMTIQDFMMPDLLEDAIVSYQKVKK